MLIFNRLKTLIIIKLILLKKLSFASRTPEFERTWRNYGIYENRWLIMKTTFLITLEYLIRIYEARCKCNIKVTQHQILCSWCRSRNRVSYKICIHMSSKQQKEAVPINSLKVKIASLTSLVW